ncbi:MAG TPA: CDP-diacylglycerol--serine O-phosphatidyltransferase [Stellaceae bacterium]|nr:CDP-diacylglycerol--serine O-phosphatidyltransferase [Stellaceae bacterium]
MRSPRVRMRVRRPRMRVRRIPERSVNRLIPNILTLLALCAGMTAIRFALTGNFQAAVYSIVVAGILDGLDGRIARLLQATSHFGAELDSLSDFISFGVAPATVMYLWTMSGLHGIGWAIVLAYAVCCALRLARFNTQLSAEPAPHMAGYFTGVPAPAGAWLVMMPMFASFEFGDWIVRSPYLNLFWISGIALLMVSRIPTLSAKQFHVSPHQVVPTLLGIGLLAAFATTAPWPTMLLLGAIYLGSIPLTMRAGQLQARRTGEPKKPEAGDSAPLLAPPALGETAAPSNQWRH